MLNRRYTCVLSQTHLWSCGCYVGQIIDYLLFLVRLLDLKMTVSLLGKKSNKSPLKELKIQRVFFFSFLAGINQGSCYRINHFPDDNDYDTDSSEYLLREC